MALVEVREVAELQANNDARQERVRRKARLLRPRWAPKEWHPVYEEVVLLALLGYSNTAIAEEKGFTVQHISNIINTPHAKIIKEITLKQMEKKRAESFEDRVAKMVDKGLSRMEETLNNDELAAKNPLGVFDRAMSLMKGVGKMKAEEQVVVNPVMAVSAEAMDRWTQAIERSKEERKALAAPTNSENFETTQTKELKSA